MTQFLRKIKVGGGSFISPVLLLFSVVCYFSYGVSRSSSELISAPEIPVEINTFSGVVSECGLKFEAGTVDFGTVFEGTKNSLAVKLINTSDHDIEVTSASASCGCTSVLTATPFRLNPGEESELEIQLNTRKNVGELEKIVNVFIAEGESHFRTPISVKANSLPLITLDGKAVDFGMVKATELPSRELTITLNHEIGSSDLTNPVYIASTPQGVRAELIETPAPEYAARQWKLKISADGALVPEQSIDGDVVVVTPSTVESRLRIPIRAKQFSFVGCEPGRVNFGIVEDGSDAAQIVKLTCSEGHRYKVESTEFPEESEFLKADYDPAERQLSIRVELSKTEKGFFKSQLRVRFLCDDGTRQTLMIPVTGYRLVTRK